MYITDLKAISPQHTYHNELLTGKKIDHSDLIYHVVEPDYMEFIPKSLLRRMGKAVRMGVGAGIPLIKKHTDLDGILIGTANGGLEDCIKFLNQIVEYNEGVLTPTNFVQSTPNAVAGQLALMGENRGYNITYTNGGLSFENAILDALLLFEEGDTNKLLIGGLEEISDYNYNIDSLSNKYKNTALPDHELLGANTPGTVCGEGASLFVVQKTADDFYAKIEDVAQITYPSKEDLHFCLTEMLSKNGLTPEDIDGVLLGFNGDIDHNEWYSFVGNEIVSNANQYAFKHLIGDYRSSSSFALWLSAHLLNGTFEAEQLIHFDIKQVRRPKRMLIYNHFDAVRHGFILLSA